MTGVDVTIGMVRVRCAETVRRTDAELAAALRVRAGELVLDVRPGKSGDAVLTLAVRLTARDRRELALLLAPPEAAS